MKHFTEFVQDFDGTYYANMYMGGLDTNGKYVKPFRVDLPEYVTWRELRQAIYEKTGVSILKCKELYWSRLGRKKYAYVDATQPNPGGDCRITAQQMDQGWMPDFS